jgi:hypothetical protein
MRVTDKNVPATTVTEETIKFVFYPQNKSCHVIITNVDSGDARQTSVDLTDLWDNVLPSATKTILKTFFKTVSSMAHEVDLSEVIGEFLD